MPQEPRRPGRVRRFLREIPARLLSRSRSTSPAPPPLQSPHHLPLVRAQVQPSRPASQSLLPPPSTPPGSTSVTGLPPTVTIAPPSSQSSTPASPPSVQSLPTVLALPQPQPQLPLVQVENLAFVEALQKHIDTLSPEEQLHFKSGSATITPEGLIAQSREYDENHHRTSRSRRIDNDFA
ncbi:hypothetical protein DFP73DRAFT_221452 [Morchella snyderi]|nr:hypothetical protein DFP73DRAFT_221452 [Morchella snyderi]